MKGRGWDAYRGACIIYFDSTQFAVYNGVSHDCKALTIKDYNANIVINFVTLNYDHV